MRHGIPLLLLCVSLWGCESSQQKKQHPSVFNGTAMTIPYKIIIGKDLSGNERQSTQEVIDHVFADINNIHNKWNPNSELSQLNRLKAGEKILISPELESLFTLSDTIYHLSDRKFDPTIETVQQLWRAKLSHHAVPTEEDVQKLTPALGWGHIHVEDHYFWKDHDLTQIDLSGIAKGLAVDLLVERLVRSGFPDVFVEWGGEIRAAGQHPDHRPWNIFISRLGDPNPDHAIAALSLHDQSIATSGDYEQFWKAPSSDGSEQVYFHVIDPQSGQPRQILPGRIGSASVLAPNCALADGLATTALLFDSIEEAKAWSDQIITHFPSIAFWFTVHHQPGETK